MDSVETEPIVETAKTTDSKKKEKAPSFAEKVCAITDDITAKETFITMLDTSDLYRWNGEIWENSGENTLKQMVESQDSEASKNLVSEVVEKVKRRTYTERKMFNHRPELIAVKNGVLNLDTGDVLPFDKDLYQTVQLPIDYDDDATCPTIDKFAEEVMGDKAVLLYEILAYCLIPDNRFKKFVIMVGEANTGKTTLVEIMHHFLGNRNISSLSLQAFTTNRFMLANIYGKLANICDDLPRTDTGDIGIIKQLTGNSPLNAERKMVQATVEFTNTAKLIFTCNKIPKAKTADDAYYNRIILIPFYYEPAEKDTSLLSKLTTDSELSGLLNQVIKARMAILSNNGISDNESTEEVARKYNIGSLDSVAAYIWERLISDETSTNDKVGKQELYNDYVGYCGYKNMPIKEVNSFHRCIQESVQNAVTGHFQNSEGERYWGYKGIKINVYAKIETGDSSIKEGE